jgi:aminoglycoside phosphotransferase (APT) family kinase protein
MSTDLSPGGWGEDPPGLDLRRFAEFFEHARPGSIDAPLAADVIAGGKSNITYEVTDGLHTWIVRRPPLGQLLATAHDMAREYRVITALRPTSVPVPETLAMCSDPAVIGAPFYVMEKVAGTPYRQARQLQPLGAERTRRISERVVDTLLTLHGVEPAAIGLSDFGRPEGFLGRQVQRWKKQWDASRVQDLALADQLFRLLAASVPADSPATIVHGDFRLDNLLVDEQDEVSAVLDWEMATIGDPLTDVALLYVYQWLAGTGIGAMIADASQAPGFLSAQESLERYQSASTRDTSEMGFYLGLAFFKFAVIAAGIQRRFIDGGTVGDGFDGVGGIIEPLFSQGIAAVTDHAASRGSA